MQKSLRKRKKEEGADVLGGKEAEQAECPWSGPSRESGIISEAEKDWKVIK